MQCCQAPGNEDRRTLTSLLQRQAAARLGDTVWGYGLLDIPDAAAATCCLQKSLLVVGCLAEGQTISPEQTACTRWDICAFSPRTSGGQSATWRKHCA